MNIKTKYDLGDKVYIIINEKLVQVKIAAVKISITANYKMSSSLPWPDNVIVDPTESWKKVIYGWIGATTNYFDEESCWASPSEFVDASSG